MIRRGTGWLRRAPTRSRRAIRINKGLASLIQPDCSIQPNPDQFVDRSSPGALEPVSATNSFGEPFRRGYLDDRGKVDPALVAHRIFDFVASRRRLGSSGWGWRLRSVRRPSHGLFPSDKRGRSEMFHVFATRSRIISETFSCRPFEKCRRPYGYDFNRLPASQHIFKSALRLEVPLVVAERPLMLRVRRHFQQLVEVILLVPRHRNRVRIG
jgi:hypothetical protein